MTSLIEIMPSALSVIGPIVGLTYVYIKGTRDVQVHTEAKRPGTANASKHGDRIHTVVTVPTGAKAIVRLKNHLGEVKIAIHDIRKPTRGRRPFSLIRIDDASGAIALQQGAPKREINLVVPGIDVSAEHPRNEEPDSRREDRRRERNVFY